MVAAVVPKVGATVMPMVLEWGVQWAHIDIHRTKVYAMHFYDQEVW